MLIYQLDWIKIVDILLLAQFWALWYSYLLILYTRENYLSNSTIPLHLPLWVAKFCPKHIINEKWVCPLWKRVVSWLLHKAHQKHTTSQCMKKDLEYDLNSVLFDCRWALKFIFDGPKISWSNNLDKNFSGCSFLMKCETILA